MNVIASCLVSASHVTISSTEERPTGDRQAGQDAYPTQQRRQAGISGRLLTNEPVRATIVTATKDRRHDPTVHGLPGLMAQIVSQPTDDAEHADDR